MEQLKNSGLMFWSLELLIIAALIWCCTKISFLFSPIGIFLSTIFVPILISGVLFYMLNPVVQLLTKVKLGKFSISRTWAVAIVFVLLFGVLAYGVTWLVPRLINQISNLISSVPNFTRETQTLVEKWSHSRLLQHVDVSKYINRTQNYLSKYADSMLNGVSTGIGSVVSTITSVTVIAVTVPVMLFYMLKDGPKFEPSLRKFMPSARQNQIIELLNKMSETISHYIGGQVIECLFVGTFTAIGYMLIGQKYALLLGVFAGVCNIIPYVGPYLGIAPSLLVAMTSGTTMIIEVIVVVVIVQQVDGNLIYPNIIGRSLQIHPLTIIVLLLAAGNIAGLAGMILAIPLYAVVKTVVQYGYNIYEVQQAQQKQAKADQLIHPKTAAAGSDNSSRND
ncbi:AI-2E family transporter [Levilactobacillus bambusae]|uniref:AI-2E family transporter n=1 Tax=Levilactobacillus bambusae TaxID=2024736 RepID=A0A2V1N0F4_9LACO|nr:AI-2E family transporter [Levilactobacillus bambusae]PWF99904.1 AI-2E family transporter [Levilactobacillus bambusae]